MIHLKRFNEGIKWNKDRPVLLKFCEEHLAYLLDEGFDVSVRLHKMENSAYKNGIRDEGYISLTSNKENNVFKRNSFKWNDVKEDLIPFLDQENQFDWHAIMRQPYFVHEQKMIEDLLKEFQSKRIHFAVVVDEFGGTSGIVTLEDILEEIIGEITDEFDEEDAGYKKLDEYNYIFEGKVMINDVCKFMQLPLETFDEVRGDSDSLAGLVLEIAGVIPTTAQVVPCGDFEFTVLEVERNRINKIKVTIKPQLAE